MTDGELIAAALTAGLPVLGGLIRSAAIIYRDAKQETSRRWEAALETSNRRFESALSDSNAVIRENSTAFAQLMQALGIVDARTQDVGKRVVEIHKETSDVHSVPLPPMLTPPAQSSVIVEEEELAFGEDTPVEIPQAFPIIQPLAPVARPIPGQRTPTPPASRTPRGGVPVTGGPVHPRAASSPYLITTKRKAGE